MAASSSLRWSRAVVFDADGFDGIGIGSGEDFGERGGSELLELEIHKEKEKKRWRLWWEENGINNAASNTRARPRLRSLGLKV